MKKILLLSFFLIFSFFHSQDFKKDSTAIIYNFYEKESIFLYKKKGDYTSYCNLTDSEYIDFDYKMFFITDLGRCANKYYIKGYYFGKEFYLEDEKENFKFTIFKDRENEYSFEEIETALRSLSSTERTKLSDYSKYLSKSLLSLERQKTLDYILSYDKKSIGVIDARPFGEYTITGAKFSIFNTSKKTIKYITFNFHGKNPVDDKVLYRAGVYNVSRKGIGPIESYEIGSWSFDNIWLTDTVDYLVLTSMVIIYMDGTSKTIPMKESLWFEDKYINNLDKLETNFKEE